jgi:hypothetical protein
VNGARSLQEPPGEGLGDGWEGVYRHEKAFAAAGLCELWHMDLGAETRFGRLADFPPGFDFSGMWWRKA